MDAITLTRQLVDIESISGNEAAVGNYLYGELCRIGYRTIKMPVDGNRFNVYRPTTPTRQSCLSLFRTSGFLHAHGYGSSIILLRRMTARIYGRGSCDAKGIIAAQIAASERLRQQKHSCRDCCLWWEKNATAWARRSRTNIWQIVSKFAWCEYLG